MPLSLDQDTRIISVTSPTTVVTVQELVDAICDFEADPVSMGYPAIAAPEAGPGADGTIEGKVDKGGGALSEIVLRLSSLWQVQFWPGSGVTTISGGSLLGGVGGVPVKATGAAGDITILIRTVDGTLAVGTGVPALSQAESDALLNIETDIASIETQQAILEAIAANRLVTDKDTGVMTAYAADNVTPLKQWDIYKTLGIGGPGSGDAWDSASAPIVERVPK